MDTRIKKFSCYGKTWVSRDIDLDSHFESKADPGDHLGIIKACRCADRKLLTTWKPFARYRAPLSVQKNPIINPEKRTVQSGDAFEDTAYWPGFDIVKF
jgi:hypothetical protein